MKPKVSVIVPVYNVSNYLEQCLDSLICQTLENIEILLINDASPDSRDDEICKLYDDEFPQINYITHKVNKGLGGARNTGIRNAKADYIAFVDSDDWLELNMLKELYNTSTHTGACITQCYFYEYHEDQRETKLRRLKEFKKKPDTMNAISVLVWNKLYKTRLFTDNDIYFPEKLASEDIATLPRLLFFVEHVALVKKGLYNYRVNRLGSITSNFPQLFTDLPKVFGTIENLLVKIDKRETDRAFFEWRVIKSLVHYLVRLKKDKTLNKTEKDVIINTYLPESFDFLSMKSQTLISGLNSALFHLTLYKKLLYLRMLFFYGRI